MQSEVLVHVKRGNIVECAHRGYIAVVDYKGNVLASVGNPQHVTYARSTVKPLQALPLLESGAAESFGLTDEELVVVCSSHSGQDAHVHNVQSILRKAGVDQLCIQCGPHLPLHKDTAKRMRERGEEPIPLHNNCSGKHAGMLALGQYIGADLSTYLQLLNPIQQHMLHTVADMCKLSAEQLETGIDGCGVPVFAMPIEKLGYAMACFGHPIDLPEKRAEACRRLIGAIQKYPLHLAGETRFETELMQITNSKVIAKSGADGIFILTVPNKGMGIVIKAEDGSHRAVFPTVVETLKQLELIDANQLKALKRFHQQDNVNWAGTKVGEIRPVFTLQFHNR